MATDCVSATVPAATVADTACCGIPDINENISMSAYQSTAGVSRHIPEYKAISGAASRPCSIRPWRLDDFLRQERMVSLFIHPKSSIKPMLGVSVPW